MCVSKFLSYINRIAIWSLLVTVWESNSFQGLELICSTSKFLRKLLPQKRRDIISFCSRFSREFWWQEFLRGLSMRSCETHTTFKVKNQCDGTKMLRLVWPLRFWELWVNFDVISFPGLLLNQNQNHELSKRKWFLKWCQSSQAKLVQDNLSHSKSCSGASHSENDFPGPVTWRMILIAGHNENAI